jgi:hypothetical protein
MPKVMSWDDKPMDLMCQGKGLEVIDDYIVVDGKVVGCPYCHIPARASELRWDDVQPVNMTETDEGTIEVVFTPLPPGISIMVHTCKALT